MSNPFLPAVKAERERLQRERDVIDAQIATLLALEASYGSPAKTVVKGVQNHKSTPAKKKGAKKKTPSTSMAELTRQAIASFRKPFTTIELYAEVSHLLGYEIDKKVKNSVYVALYAMVQNGQVVRDGAFYTKAKAAAE
jgi:hypothetical protein